VLLSAVAFAASIVTCFAPEQDCAALAIGAVDAAEREILVNAYVLTMGSGVPAALIRAHNRGVDVRLIADRLAPCEQEEGIDPLAPPASRYGLMRTPGSRTKRR
jgi:phosphatidylserine/phosphatidylglycerophosphate/cardiolipin synthase-like enzyme